MTNKSRQSGYYWVKLYNKRHKAYFDGLYWIIKWNGITSRKITYHEDSDFDEIDETPIVRNDNN